MTEPERGRLPASVRAQQERTGLTERHKGHYGIRDLGRYAVAVPGNAVAAVAVEVEPHRIEPDVVVRRERGARVLEPLVRARGRLVDAQPGGEAWLVDLPVVHPTPPLAPDNVTEELFEGLVGAGQPTRAVVDPGDLVELDPCKAPKGRVHDGRLVCPEGRLPGNG